MNVETIKKRVGSKLSIPSLPVILRRLDELLRDQRSGMRDIGELIGEDAPLAAKVLRIANSSYYGVREPVVTIEHAAAVLGVDALRNMVMEASMFKAWGHLEGNGVIDLPELWRHSILTARLCERLMQKVAGLPVTKEEMYVAGLLHDIGRLALLDTFPKEMLAAIETARTTGEPEYEVEQRVLGLNHAHAGALIANRWTLPEPVTLGILHHHKASGTDRERPVVALVVIADKLAHAIVEDQLCDAPARIPLDLRKVLKLELEDVVLLGEDFRERLDEIEV